MEFKFRAIDDKASNSTYRQTPSSNLSYFTEQALRANYSNPDLGRYHEFFRNPNDVQEAIQRQFEKDRIREEIMAAEMARRRVLEAEVRREMMVERELALRRRGDGLSLMSGQHQRLPFLHQPAEGRSLEERIALSLEERFEGYSAARREIGGLEKTLPFHLNVQPKISEVPRISEVTPLTEVSKEKEKLILLAKPDSNLSGAKRKMVTPPTEGAGELPLIGWKKKPKEEWSCAICQVSATSELGLNEHLQGKRHKAKEAGLRAQRTGKNFGIGLRSKKTGKPTKPAEVTENPISVQGKKIEGGLLQANKTRESSFLKFWKTESSKISETTFLHINKDTDSKKKNGETMQKMAENKRKKFKFWCEMCQAGAFSEKVMNNHRRGKKHVFRLQELKNNGGAVPKTRMVESTRKANEEGEVVEDGKKDSSEAVDGTVDGVEVEDDPAAAEVVAVTKCQGPFR